ncbi:YceI family protein [Allorhizobium undicola]|uniref:YceI family protein n=1 Tax=Allorhizobium undicola TaxID=78527 RepID=UPI000481734B|nr:YceI family protein [Allorhizobium undicola]
MRNIRNIVLSCAALVGVCGLTLPSAAMAEDAKAAAGVYKLDPTHTALLWSVRHNGISNYTARFGKVEATLKLDPARIESSKIEVSIDPTSVDVPYPADYKGSHANSPYASWPEEISRNEKMLNSDKFPKITFTSTSVKRTGDNTADVTGDLTFLGVTKPVTLKAKLEGALDSHPFAGVPAVAFAAEGTFDRTTFGQPVGFVGKDVTIRFDGEFIQDPQAK